MAAAAQTNTVGWDTVFAIRVERANRAIVAQRSSPTAFAQKAGSDSVSGSFEPWQIATGGDGALLWLLVPCRGVSYSGAFGTAAWPDVDLTIQVELRFVPAPPDRSAPESAGVARKALVVRTVGESPSDPPVALISAVSASKPTGSAVDALGGPDLAESVMKEMIREWLNANLGEFAHVFAVVDVNLELDGAADWAWAKPSDTGYAYQNGKTPSDGVFAVLCMTGGRTRGVQQALQVDPNAIPGGADGGFLVQEQRFLEDLILPALPKHYVNAALSDFEVVPGGDSGTGRYTQQARLKEGRRVELPSVQNDGSTYTPYLTSYVISLEGDTITIAARTETDVGWGVTAWCTSTHRFSVSLDAAAQTLKFEPCGSDVQHGTESTGEWVEKALALFAAVVLTFVLGVLTDGAAFVAGSLIIGLVTGAAGDTQEIVAAVNSGTSPDVSALAANVCAPIRWPLGDEFALVSAGLLGPLRLGGMLREEEMAAT